MIRAGQIYKSKNLIYVVTFVGIGFKNKQQVQAITSKGFTFGWSYSKAQRYGGELIAEYSTWQEAQFPDGQVVERQDFLTRLNAAIGESEE